MLLLLLIVVLAAAGGFLGELLEVAFWIVVVLGVTGAVIAFFVYRALQGLLDRT